MNDFFMNFINNEWKKHILINPGSGVGQDGDWELNLPEATLVTPRSSAQIGLEIFKSTDDKVYAKGGGYFISFWQHDGQYGATVREDRPRR